MATREDKKAPFSSSVQLSGLDSFVPNCSWALCILVTWAVLEEGTKLPRLGDRALERRSLKVFLERGTGQEFQGQGKRKNPKLVDSLRVDSLRVDRLRDYRLHEASQDKATIQVEGRERGRHREQQGWDKARHREQDMWMGSGKPCWGRLQVARRSAEGRWSGREWR
jgi:hypothetical protein